MKENNKITRPHIRETEEKKKKKSIAVISYETSEKHRDGLAEFFRHGKIDDTGYLNIIRMYHKCFF